jgi:hypothetical protein
VNPIGARLRIPPEGRIRPAEEPACPPLPPPAPSAGSNKAWCPDRVVRLGIRRLLKERLAEMRAADAEAAEEANQAFIAGMHAAPVALLPEMANEQTCRHCRPVYKHSVY